MMCAIVEKMIEDTVELAVERTRRLAAMNMINDGKLPIEDIARYTELSVETVKELAASRTW